MNEDLIKNADKIYLNAEQKAAEYFHTLYTQVIEKKYTSVLTEDIGLWKPNHIYQNKLMSIFSPKEIKPSTKDYYKYIKWLDATGKLDNYLERSVSYIFMRDLGERLDSSESKVRINKAVSKLKNYLNGLTEENKSDNINISSLYRKAKNEGVESTFIWLVNKLKMVSSNIPKEMNSEEAHRKLIKIIAGVVMHQLEEIDENISFEERRRTLDKAIRLGYSYGLTYPFIDDLLDAKILSIEEEKKYSDLIRTTLITGNVPNLENWNGENESLIKYIHSELKEAFEYIKNHQESENINLFLEQSYVFFKSQEEDRRKDLYNKSYTNAEIYIPIILKAYSSRSIIPSVINIQKDDGFDKRTFFYGIYNQLADDFADMFEDMKNGSVTPYTYYIKYHNERLDLINPFELYWTVISNLVHNVYNSDYKTREVILNRAINGLKRFKEKLGFEKYNEVMDILDFKNTDFNDLIQDIVVKAEDVDFFDKLIRDHIITNIKNEKREQEEFLDTIKTLRQNINSILKISRDNNFPNITDQIVDAANYSLEGDGKRLRPIISYVMGVNEYGLDKSLIEPLLKSLEYMHTASLIFDDLPSQDNASTRRGRKTLHNIYDVAIAELTGVFLIQRATKEQATLIEFDFKNVLSLIRYSSQIAEEICKGQALDLSFKEKQVNLQELNTMCFYKTGKGFEASLVMPAILGSANEEEIKALKKFSYHAGIAFQIKDDLLDVEGDEKLLGKSVGKDSENKSSTFVSILGLEGAKKEMWEHYCEAVEALKGVPRNTAFLKHLLSYIVGRDY